MKTLLQLILILSLNTAFGQTPIEVHHQTEAQITLVRSQIDNFRRAISDRTVDTNFNIRDYAEQAQIDQGRLDAAMVKFEDTLEKEVFQKLEPLLAQYKAFYNHSGFSREQKELILSERFTQLQNMSARLQPIYEQAIRDVYNLVPNIDFQAELVFSREKEIFGKRASTREMTVEVRTNKDKNFVENVEVQYRGYNCCVNPWVDVNIAGDSAHVQMYSTSGTFRSGYAIRYQDLSINDFPNLKKRVYQEVIYPSVKGNCRSQLCVTLRSADQSTLLRLIKQNIDKPLTLTLPDGKSITIYAGGTYTENILDYLKMVDFPEELPFQI